MSDESPDDETPELPPLHPCPVCGREMERRCGGPQGCGLACPSCGHDERLVQSGFADLAKLLSRMTPEEISRKLAVRLAAKRKGGGR